MFAILIIVVIVGMAALIWELKSIDALLRQQIANQYRLSEQIEPICFEARERALTERRARERYLKEVSSPASTIPDDIAE